MTTSIPTHVRTEDNRTISLADICGILSETDLLIEADSSFDPGSTTVSGLSFDSRQTKPGHLFVCKGVHFHAHFLKAAQEAGAVAYMCDESLAEALAEIAPEMPRVIVSDIRSSMAVIAPMVYNHPDEHLTIAGITGTKGKSTTAYMLRSILEASGEPSGMMGSIITDDGIETFESHNTTPEAPELWRHLANTVRSHRSKMVMEVSSHALKYDRVLGLHFDIACFLNIGRDHISPVEHADFEDYFTSKLKIFNQCDMAVINLNSAEIDRILDAATSASETFCFKAIHSPEPNDAHAADIWADNIKAHDGGVTFDLHSKNEHAAVKVKLGIPGLFNVDNALAAIAMATIMGVPEDAILKGLAELRVPGRMEVVKNSDASTIAIVDYAHNKLSFEALFKSVKEEYPDRLVVSVFGAPGDKALERRQQLPEAAAPYSDLIIYTEEDPAHEKVEDICATLAANTPAGTQYEIICDREKAIAFGVDFARNAWMQSSKKTILLLLAKGDETRQHRGDEYPEVKSDLQIARELLA